MRITFAQGLKKFKESPGQARLIDVREEDEFQEGHLPKAELYPLTSFVQSVQGGAFEKDQVLLVYCRSGARSGQACDYLRSQGYQQAYNIGGVLDYKDEFGPLEK